MDPQTSIIGRRDVAVIPWITIAMVAVAVAVSTALRPDGDVSDTLLIGGALAYAALASALAMLQDRPVMIRLAGSLPVYLFGSLVLVGVLAAVGILDQGLGTVFFAPIVQVAVYLGLILPTRWARAALVALLGTVGAVHALNPVSSTRDVVTMFGLVTAAWMVGALCHSAHSRAARIALMLSRSDVLTRSLNRRGFFDQFDAELAGARADRTAIALLIVDLDDFKKVNDERGHAAGDDLLRWVGETIPAVLPPKAALGRLGGDEFGILLPGATREVADGIAAAIVAALGIRISASIGVSTSQDPDTSADDYLRVADAALYTCKSTEGLQIQSLVAGSTRAPEAATRASRVPDLTYAQLSAAGGPPDRPASGVHYGLLLRGGFWIIAAAGTMIIAGIAIEGPANRWGDAILFMGAPWVILNIAFGALSYGDADIAGRRVLMARIASSMLVGLGVSIAMLAGGGITSPIVAGLYLKVLFDAIVLARGDAAKTASITVAWWIAAVALSPASQLWAAPYQLTLFAVSFALGIVGRRAFTEAISGRLRLAHTDSLTGLRNRPGFEQGAERAFVAALADGRPFGVIAFDLDDFKAVNDTQGHAAGDTLLQQVADITKDTLPSAYSVGRLGGDEFVAAVPVGSVEEAGALATALTERLRPLVGASVGCAVYPADGADLEALLRSADHRSYAAKPGRTRHSPLTVAGEKPGSGFAAA